MNRVARIAIFSIFSGLPFVGIGRLASLGMNSPGSIEQTLRNFQGNDFNVERIHGWADDYPDPGSARTEQDVRGIQEAIDANGRLKRELVNDGVEVSHIIDAEQAADGSITFYTD